MSEFSEKITAARKAKSLSQEAAAELLSVSRQAVTKWENGKSYPSTENLLAISKLYGIPLEELCPVKNSESKPKKRRPAAGILCCVSAVLALAAAAAAFSGIADAGAVLCCFIIAVPIQLFVHLYFRSCSESEDFSGIAGFDESIEYSISAVKSYLEKLDIVLCSVCTVYTGFIAIFSWFAQVSFVWIIVLFCASYVCSALLFSIIFSRKIYVHEEDYLRTKRGYPSLCVFMAVMLLSVVETVLVFDYFGIQNNTPEALALMCILLPAWAAAVGGMAAEQLRISKGGAAIFGKVFIICYAAALLLFAALPFAAKFI